MSKAKKLMKYADREIGFAGFFAILTGLILFFVRRTSFLKIIGIILGAITFAVTIFCLWNINKKRKIINDMEVIESQEKYKTYSKLYFILNDVVFHEIISKIDGEDTLLGLDEIGIFSYIEDKKKDRQGHIPETRVQLNHKNLNVTFKTLKFNRYLEGDNMELKFTFRQPETRYILSFDRKDNGFTFHTLKRDK